MTTTQPITNWTADRLDDLSGKRYLITGGNSGIGFEAAAHLRRAHADVLVAARSASKGADAVAQLKRIPGGGAVHLIQLDLASVESIRQANDAIRTHIDALDGVINNAGIMQTPQLQTADGFELQFGTNHLGHFLLNYLLFDLITARSGRIVPVSSIAHRGVPGINFDDPMFANDYSATKVYSQSKLANLMYGLELARRLEAAGSAVIAVTAHPGYSATNLQSTGPTGILKAIYKVTNRLLAQSPTAGALPEVLAVAGNGARNGAYYGPTMFGDARGPVGESHISDAAQDQDAAARLWALSEELLGITWKIA
ncbi:oxidoreductase [Salinibacterium sp. G-O1]|uniref:oxidoreductase n=1 Tax=Salinibacterium sp. G-O1 TaxID=3046208 RepID=UPI0024BAE14E|nr:oxidoreductase [Salinibacterium sp. G-O1]MDJ0335634.1 oxidoreductase [Salinibacterium sp. G-O1]